MKIKDLLAKYNENNAKNAALTEYINKKNLFQMIGKERSELVHSKFIAELIAGSYFRSGCTESTAMHFLDILLKRNKDNSSDITKMENDILTRKSGISIIEQKTEYALSKYIEDNTEKDGKDNNQVENYIKKKFEEYKDHRQFNTLVDNVKKSRIDIYIKMKVGKEAEYDKGRTVEIFIENKVECKQNDFKVDDSTIVRQTDKYYKVCSKAEGKRGKRPLQLFVYLSPMSPRELDTDTSKDKDVNKHFIQINYQDILNFVIEPLLADTSLTELQRMRLTDYVNCLELPSLSDDEDASNVKNLSIMATSEHEKRLIEEYLQDPVNKEILDATIGNQLKENGYNFYEYKGHRMLSFNEALNKALADLVSSTSELEALQQLDVIGKRGGNKGEYSPFLIYCPVSVEDGFVPYEQYVYKSHYYPTVAKALEQALNDCIAADLLKDTDGFNIFDSRGKGTSTSVYAEKGIQLNNGKFMRDDIGDKQLKKINGELNRLYNPCEEPKILKLKEDQLDSYLANCKKGILHVADSKKENYSRVGETNYHYRNDAECYCDKICDVLKDITEENISNEERDLLGNFYNNDNNDNNWLFILSVYKIQMENTTDSNEYNYRKKCFKELCSRQPQTEPPEWKDIEK